MMFYDAEKVCVLKAEVLNSEKRAHYSNAEEVPGLKNDIPRLACYSLRPEESACATDFVYSTQVLFLPQKPNC
jgi:hypothetical protein